MTSKKPLGLVLAGGLARRMGGGDKGMIRIGGQTILERALERMSPQCTGVIINANGDPSRFGFTGLPVVPDDIPDFAGPLAGILAGLDWAARNAPDTEYIASAPGDCPFLPATSPIGLKRRGSTKRYRSPAQNQETGVTRSSVYGQFHSAATCVTR
jgi:molybdenum cofactor guanylyltransferase